MLYLLVTIPLITAILASAFLSKRMHKRYKTEHKTFYESLEESTSHAIPSISGIGNLLYGIPTASIKDPETGYRVGVQKIYDDIELVKTREDEELLRICMLRWRVKQFLIVYLGLFPFIMIFIWLSGVIS